MFGDRLKVVRIENKLKQSDLATLLNVSNSTIGMYEQGRRDPDTDTIIFLANYFGVTTDWLLGVSDIRNPYTNKEKDMPNEAYLNLDILNLSNENIGKIKEYTEFLKQKYNTNKDL